MKTGFTGSQSGMSSFQRDETGIRIPYLKTSEFCHGDCIGSDEVANQIALEVGVRIFTIFPPTKSNKRAWCFNGRDYINRYNQWHDIEVDNFGLVRVRWMPPDDYLARNRHIVDNVENMIATPKELEHTIRSGTWATIRYAWHRKRPIIIIPPLEVELEGAVD